VHSQRLVGVRITQPFPSYPLQRSCLFQPCLGGGYAVEEPAVGGGAAMAMFSTEMPRCTTSTPAIGLTSSVSTGASFKKASHAPVVRSVNAVRMVP